MKLLICFGTRPEYIKVKSLINNLPSAHILFTGQHEDYFDEILQHENKIHKLDIIKNNNRLCDIIASILGQGNILEPYDYVLVQGDTASAFGIALTSFNYGVKIIHLEAGLRVNNICDPFPEEGYRQMISRIANIHLCPTNKDRQNLLNENIKENIYVTGNTVLDNLVNFKNCVTYDNVVLITLHRRDNLQKLREWFKIFSKIATIYDDIQFIFPIHHNPDIRKYKCFLQNINVVEPLKHDELVDILRRCKYVISDSGGLQEEASFLNKKIIICRRSTERPQVLDTHGVLCKSPEYLEEIVCDINKDYIINTECPFGDGYAWKKILDVVNNLIK